MGHVLLLIIHGKAHELVEVSVRAPQSQVDSDFVLGVSGAFIHRHLAHHAFGICNNVHQVSLVFRRLLVQKPNFFKLSLHRQLLLFLVFFYFHRFSLFFDFWWRL
jgi:hypothetical protein